MKKLLEKDKSRRLKIKNSEKQQFVLKSIFQNFHFFTLIRWNAFLKFKKLSKQSSFAALSPRCVFTVNKKRYNKLTSFSRHTFLKLIRAGKISGAQKSSW